MELNKDVMMSYARDLRDDLKHAYEEGEGQVPSPKDVLVMNWLIGEAMKIRNLEENMIISPKTELTIQGIDYGTGESFTAVSSQTEYDRIVESLGYTPKNLVINPLFVTDKE